MSPVKNTTIKKLEVLSQQAGLRLSQKELKEIEPLYTALRKQIDQLNQIDLKETGPEVSFSASLEQQE